MISRGNGAMAYRDTVMKGVDYEELSLSYDIDPCDD